MILFVLWNLWHGAAGERAFVFLEVLWKLVQCVSDNFNVALVIFVIVAA